jgi:ABC-type branched-subunit amino acid transport system substrate-binding protein
LEGLTSSGAEEGMEMAVAYANEYRGIAGRHWSCSSFQGGETPSGSRDCANQMVNAEVAVVLMPFTANGSSIVPVVTAGGIPYVVLAGTSSEGQCEANTAPLPRPSRTKSRWSIHASAWPPWASNGCTLSAGG